MDDRRVWTIQIEGPHPVKLEAPGTPMIHHRPPSTLAHVFATHVQVEELLGDLGKFGLIGNLITPVPKPGPFPECAKCVWLDQDLGKCSEDRPQNTKRSSRGEELYALNLQAQRDWETCPAPRDE